MCKSYFSPFSRCGSFFPSFINWVWKTGERREKGDIGICCIRECFCELLFFYPGSYISYPLFLMQRRYQFMEKTEVDWKLFRWGNFGSRNGWHHFCPFCSFYHAESPNHQTASFRPLDLYRKQGFPSDNTYFVISGRVNELAVMHQRVWLDILVCLSADDRSVTGSVLYYKKLEELAWQDFDDLHCGYGDTDYKPVSYTHLTLPTIA